MKPLAPAADERLAALTAELKLLAAPPPAIRLFSRSAATAALPHTRRRLATALLLVLAAALSAAVIWAMRSELEEVVRGEGRVIPDTSTQIIQSLEGGIVRDLLVSEGGHVTTGQVLLKMHDVQVASHYRENITARDLLRARLLRLRAEATGAATLQLAPAFRSAHPETADAELLLFAKRREDIDTNARALTDLMQKKQQKLATLLPLFESGSLPDVQKIDLESEIVELRGKVSMQRSAFMREAMEQHDEASAKLKSIEEKIRADEDQLTRTEIKSPVDGVVNKIFINSADRVVQGGQPIMEIVPSQSGLLIETRIKPADIGFIRQEQPVRVRFTAYDFTAYGSLTGTVETLGVDTVADEKTGNYYPVKVRTHTSTLGRDAMSGTELKLKPGMVAEVDILTGKRSVLDYLLKPIHRARRMALRER